jgi:hypothetical protein
MRPIAALLLGLGLGALSVAAYRPCPQPCDCYGAVDVLTMARGKIERCEMELRATGAALESAAQVCRHRAHTNRQASRYQRGR